MEIDELNITKVKMDEPHPKDTKFYIDFCLSDQMNYYMVCEKVEGKLRPLFIAHDSDQINSNPLCEFCHENVNEGDSCDHLSIYVEELSKRLLNHPTIRLRLLFM